jgi:hypothetical protein
MVSHQPAESVKSDACRDEHDSVPSSDFGETGRSRQNFVGRTRQYFGRAENVISLLTLAAVAVYTSLTYCLLNAEREAYKRVQRAFAFRMERDERRIDVVWKNGGDTPTRWRCSMSTVLHVRIATTPLRALTTGGDTPVSTAALDASYGRPDPDRCQRYQWGAGTSSSMR